MKRKKVTLDIFEESVLPSLQAKHAEVTKLQKAIDDGYDIYEDAEDGKTVAVKYTVSAAPAKSDDADDDSAEKDADEPVTKSGKAPAQRSDEDLSKLIAKSVAETMSAMGFAATANSKRIVRATIDAREGAEKDKDETETKAFKIPAEVKRFGRLKNFKNEKVNGLDPDERAFRFGMWAMAARGSDAAKSFCQQNGIGLQEAKLSDDIMQKLQSEFNNSAGGFLVPDEFGTDLIELKETYGVARKLFAREMMSSDTKTLPRRVGGLTAYFVGEGAAGTESTTSWDQIRLTAKDLMVLTRMTNQVNADSVISWADRLAYECSYANTLKEDQCAFLGDGTSTYGGITGLKTAFTNKWSTGTIGTGVGLAKQGTSNTWSAIVIGDFDNVVGSLPQYSDTQSAVWICHRTFYYSVIEKLIQAQGGVPAYETRQGQRAPRPIFKGYPVEFAQVMPSTTASGQVSAYLGDLSLGCTFGDRMQDSMAFSDQATIGGDSMWERAQTGVRCIERLDMNVHDVGDGTTVGPIVGLITG